MAARLLQVVVFPYRGCSFTAVTRVQIPSTDPFSKRFLASSGETGSFEHVDTPSRLKRLLRKKIDTETTRRRVRLAPCPLIL